MRLKSLKLAGFKSFANPTTFTFKHDITAIVGPNGCGKSNVIDAIRWVLGETSAKQLRGGAMSDVIFAGTDGKAGKSLASVELTFEHTQDEATGIRHPLNVYHELTLRRQINIEGKSDYFINGQKVRRRDVVDVFLGTGLGARSYAVIEQGMIGRIIDADGQKLREFIEEAAGVSRYQARREETEKQLAKASDNLGRLSDLHSELQKQHRSLAHQAQSAKIYEALQTKLHAVEQDILTRKLYDAWLAHNHAKKQQQALGDELHALNNQMANLKTQWEVLASELGQTQWQRDEVSEKYHTATLAYQAATHATAKANSDIAHTKEALLVLEHDDKNYADLHQKHQSELIFHQEQIATLTPVLDDLKLVYHRLKNAEQALQDTWQDVRHELDGLYHERQNLQNSLSLTQASIKRVTSLLDKDKQKHIQLTKEKDSLAQQQVNGDSLLILKEKLASKKAQLDTLEDDLNVDKQRFIILSQRLHDEQAALNTQEKTHSRLSSEYDTLHKFVYPPKSAYQEKINSDKTAQSLALMTLKDKLTLSKQGKAYVSVLDKFLATLLSDGVLDDKLDNLSLSQILSCDGKVGVWRTSTDIASKNIDKLTDKFVPLSALIVSPKLSLWERVSVFDDSQGDVPDWQALPTELVLTTSGWILSAVGAVPCQKLSQGSKNDFLSQRQAHLDRLASLEDELNALEEMLEIQTASYKKNKSEHENLSCSIDERTAQIRRLTQEYGELNSQQTKLNAELVAQQKDSKRISDEMQNLAHEQSQLELELEQLTYAEKTNQDKLATLVPVIDVAKAKQDKLGVEQSTLNNQVKDSQEKLQAMTLQLQSHTQAVNHIQAVIYQEAQQSTKRSSQKQALTDKLAMLMQALPELMEQEKTTATLVAICQQDCENFDILLNGQKAKQTTLQGNRANTQEKIDDINTHLAAIGADVAVAVARMQDLGGQLGERVVNFNLTARLADFDHPNFDVQTVLGGDMDELVGEQKRLANEIGKLGAVNLGAKAELDELESRLNPMQKEIDDVKASIDTLKNAIDTINQKTKGLFLAMLKSVNEELNALFAKVFGGGQASLTLMDDDTLTKADKWRAGLVLMAQPKGKKNSRLAVLSGGEKTLTALSLIFAIFKQNPAPFCVLDEVDAPLDDANVGRFTHLIGELSNSVQFIFISHNKLAMQTAHELKGVTMPTAGISSLVSVDIEAAMGMIA